MKDAVAHKRTLGQYYTERDAFSSPAFAAWYARATQGLPVDAPILEPFVGAGHIPRSLHARGIHRPWHAVDLDPPTPAERVMPGLVIHEGNSLRQIPKGFALAITNPPYLARNWARRRRLPFPKSIHDDLYKHALDRMLARVPYVAAIVPGSFLTADAFHDRLSVAVALREDLFEDTECPVCLALFEPLDRQIRVEDFEVWDGVQRLGWRSDFTRRLEVAEAQPWIFNDPSGALALFGVDNIASGPSIRFALGKEVPADQIKHSSRIISRIGLPKRRSAAQVQALVDEANRRLNQWRRDTHDMLLAPFRGQRQDGHWRRRLDFATARRVLDAAWARVT